MSKNLNPSSPSPPQQAEHHQLRSLDDTIEHCIGGGLSWRQFLQSMIASLAWFFDSQQTFISVFTDAEPTWSCKNSSCNATSSNICHLPTGSWSWELPARASTLSEWSLHCAGPIMTGLPASSFFLGCLAGALALATLADSSLGRKKTLVFCCLLMSIPGALTAISNDVWMYCVLRFLSGFGRATIGPTACVHASELVGRKWRHIVGVIGFVFFTFGFLSLPIIAFLLRGSSWRLIYLSTCVPCVFFSLLLYFSVDESPRWLFVRGRKEEFAKVLNRLASHNHTKVTETFLSNCMEWKEESKERNVYVALKILLSKRWAIKRLVGVMVVGFGIGLTYYGMPLGLGNLSFNLYLSVALNALSELPSSLATFYLIGKLKRKSSVLGLALLSGICSMASAFVRLKGIQMALEMVSFFGACTAFDVSFIYTLELFPTCVRNSAMSMLREANLLGGVLGPMLAGIGRKKGLFMSYGVFGVTFCLCGLFVALLPETKGRKLYDTMEEVEEEEEELHDAGEVRSA